MQLLSLIVVLIAAGLVLCVLMACAWAIQQRTGNSSWIDFGWTSSVGLVGTASALLGVDGVLPGPRQWLIALLCACWCVRLAWHLLARALRGIDDPRYAALAKQWGGDASRRMFWFAQSQALAALPLVLAVVLAAHRPGVWPDGGDVAGMLVVTCAIIGAAVSDAQLRRFTADPSNRGKVCDSGLWRWSRHPNYFFEWLGWVGFAITALAASRNDQIGWLALLAPLEMYVLLVYVSGIPPLEAHMAQSRSDSWASYRSRTSAFFPWPPFA